jgi:hypothetical protein
VTFVQIVRTFGKEVWKGIPGLCQEDKTIPGNLGFFLTSDFEKQWTNY